MYKIMIVEDDRSIASNLATVLQGWGFDTAVVSDFSSIIPFFMSVRPDLVLMDLGLPERNGFFWTREIRNISSLPIVFISSADESMNIVTALSQGADDYVTKPFDTTILATKIQALLRRAYDYAPKSSFLEHKGVRLDTDRNEAIYKEKSTELSKNEARILRMLMEHKGTIVTREALMEALWKTDCYIDENTLSVNVNRLRRKLESIDLFDFIHTRKGIGYMI